MANSEVPLKDPLLRANFVYYTGAALLIILFAYSRFVSGILKSWRRSLQINSLPGPTAIPFVATLDFLWIRNEDIFDRFNTWCREFKGCFKIWMVQQPMVVVHSRENVKRILGSSDHLAKPTTYNVVMDAVLGKGLATADVDSWKAHRRVLTPAVNGRILNDFLEILNEDSNILCKVMRKDLDKAKNSRDGSKKLLDLHHYYHYLFLNIIVESVTGVRQNYLEDGTDISMFTPEANERTKEILLTRWTRPFLQWDWLWNLHPWGKEEVEMKARGTEYYQQCIDTRREQLRSDNARGSETGMRLRREAILDTLLKLSEKPESGITDEYIIYEMATFIIAGHDTNSETLGYASFMLALHPEIQERCYEEVVSVFGKEIDRPMTFEDLARLTYLEQVIKETQRLYPVIPMVMREAGCDVVLEEGYTVPKGSTVCVWFPGLHRDPSVFPNPETFNPDNFAPEKCESIDQYTHAPYSAGLRNCVGKKLSCLQLKVVLARLVLHFKITCAHPTNPKNYARVIMGPTPHIRYGLEVRS